MFGRSKAQNVIHQPEIDLNGTATSTATTARRDTRPRHRVLAIVALAGLLVAGIPGSASAYSTFGRAGQGSIEASCNSYSRTITFSVNMWTNVVPQAVGYNLYVWTVNGWYRFSSQSGTPEGSYFAFATRLTVSGPNRTHHFYVQYVWFQNGAWRVGNPSYEQFQINC